MCEVDTVVESDVRSVDFSVHVRNAQTVSVSNCCIETTSQSATATIKSTFHGVVLMSLRTHRTTYVYYLNVPACYAVRETILGRVDCLMSEFTVQA